MDFLKCLDENKQLILAILDNQNLGKLAECAQYQALLQQNLLKLAAIADSQPQFTVNPQQPAGLPPRFMEFHPQSLAAKPPQPPMRQSQTLGIQNHMCLQPAGPSPGNGVPAKLLVNVQQSATLTEGTTTGSLDSLPTAINQPEFHHASAPNTGVDSPGTKQVPPTATESASVDESRSSSLQQWESGVEFHEK